MNTPTIQDIIRANAERMKDVTVTVDERYETVTISDDTGEQEEIFLDGEDAHEFICKRDELWEETGDLSRDVIELHLASTYVENLWN